jgi:hypothetical protein
MLIGRPNDTVLAATSAVLPSIRAPQGALFSTVLLNSHKRDADAVYERRSLPGRGGETNLPRSLHLPLASTDGSATEKVNKTGVRLWTDRSGRESRHLVLLVASRTFRVPET